MNDHSPGIDALHPTYAVSIRMVAAQLAAAGVPSARLDAEVLLRHAAGLSRTELFMRYPDPVPAGVRDRVQQLVAERLQGAPVAYLIGRREFMGMPFLVAPGVLIPRPETEILVEWALSHLVPGSTVVDVGTGSGAIAVSIVGAAHDVTVIATDISPDALRIAGENVDRLLDDERRGRISFREGSLLKPIGEPVEMVLANLPYLTPEQVDGNPDLAAEPRLALDGGVNGLDLIRELVADLPRVLTSGGLVGLEIDPDQQGTVEELLRTAFPGRVVETLPDLAGLARHVVMRPAGGARL